ncbi:MAG: DNA primase [Lachnospiraceae bacterium]
MFYSEEIIEEVRSKNDIVDVVSGYVKIQKKGGSYFGLCPFHNEKSPSFSVSRQKQMYYCFGCNAGGNVISFVMKYENYTFQEAVKMLAQRVNISLPEVEFTAEQKSKINERTRLLEVNKEAAKYYYFQLRSEVGKIGYDYFKGRELSEEIMKKFGLGFAKKTRNELTNYLKSKGYKDHEMIDAGLAGNDERSGIHDKFWNRVMFPIQDINNKVIGFGGRVMGEGEPKYLNSKETMIFDKSRNLYGLNFARSSREDNIILCEGYMDVIAMHQAGFTQAIASLGTAFTPGQANLLRRYTNLVYLAYDSDNAGVKAAIRAIQILKEMEITVKVISLLPYKDPDEFIKNLGIEEFKERMKVARNSFFFELDCIQKEYDLKDPESKTKFHREIAKKLCNIEEEMERENYIRAVSSEYELGYEQLKKLVFSFASQTGLAKPIQRPKSGIQKKNTVEENIKKAQRSLITWLSEEPSLYPKIQRYISVEDFTTDLYKQVAQRLFDGFSNEEFHPASIINMFDEEEKQQEVAALFNTKMEELPTHAEKEKAFHDILLTVKRNSYEYYSKRLGNDVLALNQVIAGKKALEELEKTHISLEE